MRSLSPYNKDQGHTPSRSDLIEISSPSEMFLSISHVLDTDMPKVKRQKHDLYHLNARYLIK